QAADDFVIPTGQSWNIQQIFAAGTYQSSGPMPFVNLYFYSDSGGYPGASIATYLNASLQTDIGGNLTVAIPGGGLLLGPGTYWVSVQAGNNADWYWTNRTTVSNNAAVWRN